MCRRCSNCSPSSPPSCCCGLRSSASPMAPAAAIAASPRPRSRSRACPTSCCRTPAPPSAHSPTSRSRSASADARQVAPPARCRRVCRWSLFEASAQAAQAFAAPLRAAEALLEALHQRQRDGSDDVREMADEMAAIEAESRPFAERYRLVEPTRVSGPVPLACATRWLESALTARRSASTPDAAADRAGANALLLFAAALDGRAATDAVAQSATLLIAATRSAPPCDMSAPDTLAATAVLMADARQSVANGQKNAAMLALIATAGTQWVGAMAARLRAADREPAHSHAGPRRRRGARAVGGGGLGGARAVAARGRPRVRAGAHRCGARERTGAVRLGTRRGGAAHRGDRLGHPRSASGRRGRRARDLELARRLRRLRAGERARLAAAARAVGERPSGQPLSRALSPGSPVARHADPVGAAVHAPTARARARLAAVGRRRGRAFGDAPARRRGAPRCSSSRSRSPPSSASASRCRTCAS